MYPSNSNSWVMIVCLGPSSSGKTLLLKNLQCRTDIDHTTACVPTTGTNMFTVKIENKPYTIRELGGEVSLLWSNYLQNVEKVMYVIDTSNLCQISAAGVMLYTILVNPLLKNSKFLLVLTKMDVSYRQMRNEALLMLQMDRLRGELKQNLVITETSSVNDTGRQDILSWIKN